MSLSGDTGDAGITVDSCQNAGATNEQKVFSVSSWFGNLLLFCLQWKSQYSRNYKGVCAKNTNVCVICISGNVNMIELPSKEFYRANIESGYSRKSIKACVFIKV